MHVVRRLRMHKVNKRSAFFLWYPIRYHFLRFVNRINWVIVRLRIVTLPRSCFQSESRVKRYFKSIDTLRMKFISLFLWTLRYRLSWWFFLNRFLLNLLNLLGLFTLLIYLDPCYLLLDFIHNFLFLTFLWFLRFLLWVSTRGEVWPEINSYGRNLTLHWTTSVPS